MPVQLLMAPPLCSQQPLLLGFGLAEVGGHRGHRWDLAALEEGSSALLVFVCCDAGKGAATLSEPQAGGGSLSLSDVATLS